jgi:glycerol-3-phosphate cytidylyltransferase
MKTILTYGTFDLFHIGHLNLLTRLRELGDQLIVGVSTDSFNAEKGKKTVISFEDRAEIVRNLKCVDLVIPERGWAQKADDIAQYQVSVFGMGNDWAGHFDQLKQYCEVIYLPRTAGVSSSDLKKSLAALDRSHVTELKQALDLMSSIVEKLD